MSGGASVPELSDAIAAVVDNRLQGIHTVLPGMVEKYDRATCKASVKPLLKKRYVDGTEQSLPVIVNVPVVWPRTANFEMTAPMERGDGVLLVFSERSLDAWLSKGSEVAPPDARKFDLSDAIAIPGLFSFKQKPTEGSGDDVVVRYKRSSIRIKKAGGIELGKDTDTLRAVIDERLIQLYNAHTHIGVTVGTGVTGIPSLAIGTPILSECASATTKVG